MTNALALLMNFNTEKIPIGAARCCSNYQSITFTLNQRYHDNYLKGFSFEQILLTNVNS